MPRSSLHVLPDVLLLSLISYISRPKSGKYFYTATFVDTVERSNMLSAEQINCFPANLGEKSVLSQAGDNRRIHLKDESLNRP